MSSPINLYCIQLDNSLTVLLFLLFSERKLPSSTLPTQNESKMTTEKVQSALANEIARDSFGGVRKSQSASNSPNISMFNSAPASTTLTYKLGRYI
jgi:hypothetical protein